MNQQTLSITFEQYNGLEDLEQNDQDLCREAVRGMESSHSPYSGFRVGCAVQLDDHSVVLGSNQENVAYPSGLCAERVALFSIGAHHPNRKILKMAITAHTDHFEINDPVTSCGACLQVMAEYEKKQNHPIEVIFYCRNGQTLKVTGIQSLLPFAFAETRLKK